MEKANHFGLAEQQDQYLNFIQKELSPNSEQHFHTAVYRVLIGFSPWGQFALHSLWKAPSLFEAYKALNTADFKAVGCEGDSAFNKNNRIVKGQKHKKSTFIYACLNLVTEVTLNSCRVRKVQY